MSHKIATVPDLNNFLNYLVNFLDDQFQLVDFFQLDHELFQFLDDSHDDINILELYLMVD